jgi:hypothetical protein
MRNKRFLVASIFFLCAIIFAATYRQFGKQRYARQGYKILPKFKSVDVLGRTINNNILRNKVSYIQFVNSFDPDDIDLIKKVYFNWKDENITIIVITNNLENFKSKSGIDIKDIIVINNDYERMKLKFNSPTSQGSYYLFSASGKTVSAERNNVRYERGIKIFLNRLIKNKYFSISDFVKTDENIKNTKWFGQVAKILEKEDKNFFLISMFTSICDTCPEGSIINYLNKIHSDSQDSVYVLSILNQNFNKHDIENLKSQLNIGFPIITADLELSQKWNFLI